MTTAALIVAAGRGLRAGRMIPKQWQHMNGKTVADHTVFAFAQAPRISHCVIVLHSDDMDRRDGYETQGLIVATGGDDRATSVRNGLSALDGTDTQRVLIHDVARPCVSQRIINDVIDALDHTPGAAPALAVTDALWTGTAGVVTGTKDRSGLFRAQTPQGFDFNSICAAHATHQGGAADDVEVARAAGLSVAIVPGEEDNLKITLPEDFERAERILRARYGH